MPSLHPLTNVLNNIQTENVRAAFLKVIGDARSPNQLLPGEMDRFFKAATDNDKSVRGHDLTAAELADLQMIGREGGAYLFRNAADRRAYTNRVATYEAKPKVDVVDTDPKLDVKCVALNKVALKGTAEGDMCPSGVVCIIGGPTTVSMQVDGQHFGVQPAPGERASSIAKRLVAELAEGGYRAAVRTEGGRSILTVSGQAPLHLRSLTTDRAVNMAVIGSTVSINVGIGGPIHFDGRGRIGVELKGKQYTERTAAGMNVGECFDRLRAQLEAAGYEVKVNYPHTIDTFAQVWDIRPARRADYKSNTITELTGQVVAGGADGSERYLQLPQRIRVDNHIVEKLRLSGNVALGGPARFSGQLDVRELDGHAGQYEVLFSGVSNLTAGEPRFAADGKFYDDAGKALEALHYNRPQMWDAPGRLWVLDQGHDRAFVGAMGGMIRPPRSHFHGFNDVRPIRDPSRTDIGAVRFHARSDTPAGARVREEWPHTRAGVPLEEVGNGEQIVGKRWFLDPATDMVYGFDITGPDSRTMVQVIKDDPRDV